MKKQLSPSQTLWLFGVFALIAFILSAFAFLNFRQAFKGNAVDQELPEGEIVAEPTNEHHGVDVMRGGKTVVVSNEQNDVPAETVKAVEQPQMVENIVFPEVSHQPEEKTAAQTVIDTKTVEEKTARSDVKPENNATQNKETVIPSDKNRRSGVATILNVQGLATGLGGGEFERFPECRLYILDNVPTRVAVYPGQENVPNMNFFKETLEKLNAMTSVAAFLDKKSKFDTKQTAPEGVVYNMVAWTGAFLVKKAGTYTFLSTFGRKANYYETSHGIAVFVNGKGKLAAGPGTKNIQSTLDVDLKPGMANLMVVVYANNQSILTSASPVIRYKLKNVICDYREITPANLYHKIEEEDW